MVANPALLKQNGASATVMPSDKRYAALLNDGIFAGIHNAFLMGSSLVELKGRVQIAACISSIGTITLDSGATTFQIGSPVDNSSPLQEPDAIEAVLKSIVLPQVPQMLAADLRDHTWLTSVFRAIFKQIVGLHIKRFPNSTIDNSIYFLPPTPDQDSIATYPYPHLYPDAPPDNTGQPPSYANMGIGCIANPIDNDGNEIPFVEHFRLYDATRRALNCLTLLLDNAQECLAPSIIAGYQQTLVQTLLGKPPDAAVTPDDSRKAIKMLGDQVIGFLEAWDSFLRECFYSSMGPQNDPNASAVDNELEFAAYEAGRALAALSWNISVATAPLENALASNPAQGQASEIAAALTLKARNTWQQVFNDRDLNNLQYQINALSTALDQAYYRVNPDMKPANANDPTAPLNPDLPGQAIQAVKNSIDYWQRAITRVCSSDVRIKPALSPFAITSSAVNGAGTNQPTLLNWTMSKTLRMELIQQVAVWQSLILCQQSVSAFSMETITQRILNDFVHDLEMAASQEIKKLRWTGWVFVGIVGVIIVLLVIAGLTKFQGFTLNALVSSPFVIITAIGAAITPFMTGITGRLSKFGSFFGSAGTTLEESLQRGYERMLIEFDILNHTVAITFPLVEFFIWEDVQVLFKHSDTEEVLVGVRDGYDFLVKVFWTSADREAELQRVAQAAFGPITALVQAQLNSSTARKGNNAKKP